MGLDPPTSILKIPRLFFSSFQTQQMFGDLCIATLIDKPSETLRKAQSEKLVRKIIPSKGIFQKEYF